MTATRLLAEWQPHEAVWIGFPSHADLWLEDLDLAQEEVAGFARAVHAGGRGEQVILVANDDVAAAKARALAGDAALVATQPFGDVWLRDTGAIVVRDTYGQRLALHHKINGWGGKYELQYDDTIGARLASDYGIRVTTRDWILEGGALDVDGAGLAVTTEQCLLNPNRNPGMSRAEIEARLRSELGIERLLWLGEGLANDHTDGHVDNLARFVAPGVLALPEAAEDDPNLGAIADAHARAAAFGVDVVSIPSLGRLEDDEGAPLPASHMNFYIGNMSVVVPTYGTVSDSAAVAAIAKLFPARKTMGLRANALLTGGGSFHCITQQVPKA
ncbi:MAG: agmatine deiminase family protein [Alphaproteobacteria bacterium]|nr:agmatine deiminase family protein [Alphaproteobacteria bacterium]MDE2340956.1 agmatine deiminase family protein [Alphaproteobacteria bacterium]